MFQERSSLKPSPETHTIRLKPPLVFEIYSGEVTHAGVFRHPVYIAVREDKEAESVKQKTNNHEEEVPGSAPGWAEKERPPNSKSPLFLSSGAKRIYPLY